LSVCSYYLILMKKELKMTSNQNANQNANETNKTQKVLLTCASVIGLSLVLRGFSYYFQNKISKDQSKQMLLSNNIVIPTESSNRDASDSVKDIPKAIPKSDYVSSSATDVLETQGSGKTQASSFNVQKGKVQMPLQMLECPIGSYRFETFTSQYTPQYQTQAKQVSITKPFLLSAHEITQSFYTFIKANNPSKASQTSNAPVDSISWFDALDFCNQLSIQCNLQPCYKITQIRTQDTERDGTKTTPFIVSANVEWDRNANGFRLPTEEEWQYAAIANSKTAYIGSDLADECCWYKGNSSQKTQAVGMKKPNAWGFYDMGGNVDEFCWNSVEKGNPNQILGNHVIKGGSFISPKENLFATPSFRSGGFRGSSIGFRVAKNT